LDYDYDDDEYYICIVHKFQQARVRGAKYKDGMILFFVFILITKVTLSAVWELF